MPQSVGDVLKEKRQQELHEIEQRRNVLLPEHQKMQKRSQKLQRVCRITKEEVPDTFGMG